ncbi:WecB/TagA/CpsF family glycosyltransferase [Patescibacteria group bacterium]|nr:WecB/TagA/CpsF family glycosyltransferase [Patescibacteria group bacterium]
MKKDVLGVKVNDITIDEALAVVEKWICNPGKHYIVTPNPEFIIAAQKDNLFRKILNDADLSIPDGVGLKLAGKVKNTFSGTDFMEKLVNLSAEKGLTTGFLGGRDEVAKECAECLQKKYPGLKVAMALGGGEVDKEGKTKDSIAIPPCDILLVAFGHIKQEKWIVNNLQTIPVKLAMGVGGAFDYLSGNVPRAPRLMRDLGFEWLFRLILQPWRIKRQLALCRYLWLTVFKGKQ